MFPQYIYICTRSFVRSFIHSFIHSSIHSFIHSFVRSYVRPFIHSFFFVIRRALFTDLYTADEVHLLPGYPSNASASLLVAFYVQQPLGLFIGNVSVLPGSTLLKIIVFYKPELEDAIGANISDAKALFTATTTMSPTQKPVEPSSSENWKWIVIGVSVGVVVLFLLIVIAVWW